MYSANYFIQFNDVMTPIKINLTLEELNGIIKLFESVGSIEENNEDALMHIEDEDGNEYFDNYNKWIKYHIGE